MSQQKQALSVFQLLLVCVLSALVFGLFNAERQPVTSADPVAEPSPDGRMPVVAAEAGQLLRALWREETLLPCLLYGFGFVLWPLLWGLSRKPRATALQRAQQAVGDVGRHLPLGHVDACFFGHSTLEPMFRQTWERLLAAYSELVGEPVTTKYPLLVLVFEEGRAYEAFLNDRPSTAGVYRTVGGREIVICEQWSLDRSIEPEQLLGWLLADYLFDCQKHFRAPAGLAAMLGWLLTSDGDARLAFSIHRMLRAALDRNEPCLQDNPLVTSVPESARHAIYWNCQAAALAQYLAGAKFTTRREQFTSFLRELSKREALEVVLERNYACSLSALTENWHCWEVMQPIEQYDPPPASLRRHVAEKVVPLVLDPTVSRDRRLEAIRHLGTGGDVTVGAVLIELLQAAEDIAARAADREPVAGSEFALPYRADSAEPQTLQAEASWALELLSGEAFGCEVQPWREWWERVRFEVPACESECEQAAVVPGRGSVAAGKFPAAAVAAPLPTGWISPPRRLKLCWALLIVGGVLAVIPAVFGALCLEGLLSWLSYASLAIGSGAIATGAGRELRGLPAVALLLVLSLCSLNVVSAVLGLVALLLSRHTQVQQYLRLQV